MAHALDLRSQMLAAFAQANPDLAAVPAPQPEPTASAGPASTQRVLLAGGDLAARFAHPTFIPFEKLYRKFPQQGIFTASPQNNFVIELGSFRIPQQMVFALVDYSFTLYRLSGAAAGDWVPLEDRRLSGQIGYDVLIDDYRMANIAYQLDPTPITSAQQQSEQPLSAGIIATGEMSNIVPSQLTNPSFPGLPPGSFPAPGAPQFGVPGQPIFPPSAPPFGATASDFTNAAAAAASATGGPGLSLQPQRATRLGPLPLPFTMLVRANQRCTFKVVVFRPVPIPLAFFEVDVTGVLMPANVADSLFGAMAPYVPQGTVKR